MDEQAEIVIFDRGSFVSFANCGLPYFIGGVIEKEKSLLVADEKLFKDRFNIDVHTETEVVSIDREEKTVSVLNRRDNQRESRTVRRPRALAPARRLSAPRWRASICPACFPCAPFPTAGRFASGWTSAK